MKWAGFLLLIIPVVSQASPQQCFTRAGHDYGIDPLLLTAISIKESRLKFNAVNSANSNKTEDVCGMQINSSHYGTLKQFGINRERLLNDPCVCVYTGAWVLARNFDRYGKNWDSVGMYNTGPSDRLVRQRRAYADHIRRIYYVLRGAQGDTGKEFIPTGINQVHISK